QIAGRAVEGRLPSAGDVGAVIEDRFEVEGTPDLDVSVPAGSLTIDPGSPGSVVVQVDTNRPESWHVGRSGNHIWVDHERWTVAGRSSWARWRIVAPPGTTLNARTVATDIRISVPLERATVVAAAGEVEVDHAAQLAIQTASGDVRIGAVDGDLEVRSASGDVDVGRVGTSASVTSASGDVTIESVRSEEH